MRCIAIIPARSGSKGLKDKNIRELCGKPLIAYTIEAAIKSEIFDCVHVSTDSDYYAQIARQYGADVPFLRTAECATDIASSWDVVRYVLTMYQELGYYYDVVVLLQPTSPLRTDTDIRDSFYMFMQRKANAIVSMCETEHSPLCTNTLPEDCNLESFVQENVRDIPRQQLPTYYRANGAIYIVRSSYIMKSTNLYTVNCYAYIMDKKKSVDIDDEMDFEYASICMRQKIELENES